MMPISQVEEMHGGSILARRYVHYEMKQNFDAADSFWKETTGWSVLRLLGTAWIRRSTGKLCLNIGDGYQSYMRIFSIPPNMRKLPSFKLTENDMHNKLLLILELDQFYSLPIPSIWSRHGLLPSTAGTVALPSVCIAPDRHFDRKFNWNERTSINFTNSISRSATLFSIPGVADVTYPLRSCQLDGHGVFLYALLVTITHQTFDVELLILFKLEQA
ncbi:hypothetical protein C8R45DRAFT_1040897 [Mycena sanguinolenta]|nr:hypothetical protein C8R45DRAFT_1040897 [Mycena sanguinolenta]